MLCFARLLLWLLAASLVTTAAVHAREFSGSQTTIDCSGSVHSDEDADQTPADADGRASYHHSHCHGAFANVPTGDQTGFGLPVMRTPAMALRSSFHERHVTGPALRPPIA
jgi:hypothetical protein